MPGRTKTVLIVDDMPTDLRLLKILLTSLNFHVVSASSGEEALAVADSQPLDLIMLDVIMPKMDGVETIKQLRSKDKTKDIPIILVSSLAAPSSEILDKYNSKTIGYIEKPLKADVLKETISRFISSDHSSDSKKAYIACRSKLFSKAFSKSCKMFDVEPVLMRSEMNILEELEACHADIIFVQDKILDDPGHHIVDQIKAHELFADSYLVIGSAEKQGGSFAEDIDADFFLPIPFLKHQVEAIFREVLNLPKKVLIVSPENTTTQYLFSELSKLKYELQHVCTAEEARVSVQEFFPDIIYSRYDLPDMNGAELCSLIKNKAIFRHMHYLVESHESTAKIMSECFDAGADDIVLEKRTDAKKLKLITSLVSSPNQGRKSNILLVAHSNTVKGKVARLLRRHNYNVVSTSQIADAEERVRRESFDVIIMSYLVARDDNWQFCIGLLSNKKTQDVPMIMLCSDNHSDDVKKLGNLLSISDVIYTPFKNDEFLTSVQSVVEGVHARLEKNELARYVPLDAVKHVGEIVSGIKEAEVEEKVISILFSDICSFTAKCEELEAGKMVAILNSYFDVMSDVITRNKGIVDKFIGDAIVARFDSGDEHEDAMNSARAAREMFEVLNEWNKACGQEFEIRIGINSGEVVLGNIGSSRHLRSYTMIGDNVNIAQRLEAEAPTQSCYIAEATALLLDDTVEVGELHYIKVKGKKIPVGICELIID